MSRSVLLRALLVLAILALRSIESTVDYRDMIPVRHPRFTFSLGQSEVVVTEDHRDRRPFHRTDVSAYRGNADASTRRFLKRLLGPSELSRSFYWRAKTTTALAGTTIEAETTNPCNPGPLASMPPPLPAAIGFTK